MTFSLAQCYSFGCVQTKRSLMESSISYQDLHEIFAITGAPVVGGHELLSL